MTSANYFTSVPYFVREGKDLDDSVDLFMTGREFNPWTANPKCGGEKGDEQQETSLRQGAALGEGK